MSNTLLAVACLAGGVAMGGLAVTAAAAEDFPAKPVTLMMPYAAGGPGDTITRIIGAGMSRALGKQFLVENTAGAGGTIGTAKIAPNPEKKYSKACSQVALAERP